MKHSPYRSTDGQAEATTHVGQTDQEARYQGDTGGHHAKTDQGGEKATGKAGHTEADKEAAALLGVRDLEEARKLPEVPADASAKVFESDDPAYITRFMREHDRRVMNVVVADGVLSAQEDKKAADEADAEAKKTAEESKRIDGEARKAEDTEAKRVEAKRVEAKRVEAKRVEANKVAEEAKKVD